MLLIPFRTYSQPPGTTFLRENKVAQGHAAGALLLVLAQPLFPSAFPGSELRLGGGKGLPVAARGCQTRASPAAVAAAPPTCHLQRALGACDYRCRSASADPPPGCASWLRPAPGRAPCSAPPSSGLGTGSARKVLTPGFLGLASQQSLQARRDPSYTYPDTQVRTQSYICKD